MLKNLFSINLTKSLIQFIVLLNIILIASCSGSNDKTTKVSPENRKLKQTQARLVGVWYDEEASKGQLEKIGYKFAISKEKLFVTSCMIDEENLQNNASTGLTILARELEIKKTRFIDIERPNEYYIVDGSKNLLIFDQEGLIVKCEGIFFDGKNW